MELDKPLHEVLRELRTGLGISQRQLADEAGVRHSSVRRAESGADCRLSTWIRLFEAIGYAVEWSVYQFTDEGEELHAQEAERRRERKLRGLCAGRWRF